MAISPDAVFELLDELMLKGRLDQKEQEALRFTAVLQISAHAMQKAGLEPTDHRLLALLLARWGFALTDVEQSIDELNGVYEVSSDSLARTLGLAAEVVVSGLDRLAAASLIDLSAPGATPAINFAPTFTAIGAELAETLYREFLEREGSELAQAAAFYLESIDRDIDELGEWRPADPHLRLLASDYRAFKARTSIEELMARWLGQPTALYAWLSELVAYEEQFAILSGTPGGGLQTEMAGRAGKKILILGRHLAPPSAPANAA